MQETEGSSMCSKVQIIRIAENRFILAKFDETRQYRFDREAVIISDRFLHERAYKLKSLNKTSAVVILSQIFT
jgi:hypothetical protein